MNKLTELNNTIQEYAENEELYKQRIENLTSQLEGKINSTEEAHEERHR